MHKYFFLVVGMMVLLLMSLNYYAGLPQNQIKPARPVETDTFPEESVTIFEQYELFRSTGGNFQFSYPSSWVFVDTTVESQGGDGQVVQSWSLTNTGEVDILRADFTLRKGKNTIFPVTLISCTKPNISCEKETHNGIAYTKATERTDSGNVITYEAEYGEKSITVKTTIPQNEQSQKYTQDWEKIVSSFRMYK